MEKEVKLFDKRFVYFMWDDELEGKDVFVADNINSLIERVEKGASIYKVRWSKDMAMPFEWEDFVRYRFAYYDPNYKVKWAYYKEDKQIQVAYKGANNWVDCDDPEWVDGCQFRIKPEEKIAYVHKGVGGYFIDDFIEGSFYQGTIAECEKWIEEHKKKCPCEDGIDSKACAGCPQDEARKERPIWADAVNCEGCLYQKQAITEEPCVSCSPKHLLYTPKEKAFRPFKDCDELVKYWTEKYQSVARPANTMPLIWVRKKEGPRRSVKEHNDVLITGFDNDTGGWGSCVFLEDVWIDLKELFDDYEFLDGKPCGMEVKE